MPDANGQPVSHPFRGAGWGVLCLALLLPLPVFLGIGYLQFGLLGVGSALVAGGTCAVAAMASLLVSRLFIGPQAVNGVLAGMLVRMTLPMGLMVVLLQSGSRLLQGGILGMLLIYYFIGLIAETVVAVRTLDMSQLVRKVD